MTSLVRARNRNMNSLQREIDRLFENFFPSTSGPENNDSGSQAVWAPRTDLTETPEAYRIALDLPGMSKDDLKINYKDHTLSVSGERSSQTRAEDEDVVRVERAFGHFYRSFTLPNTVNSDAIEATYENGVLTIHVPKAEESKPKQITIN
ncbi:Hsp20/alpha crystallin family protein [Salisaeta longa]|uniref:Hsp20/alpha crystallin family protein n=1 Tax=Salisaeta longa TaxID=503170 RepID=UPI0003B415E9|nr:Hsp20/alpha crystallin family protein [Salisaeta longa]